MSDTLTNVEARVRDLTDDRDPSNYAISQRRLWRMIDTQVQEIGARIGMGQAWSTTVFSTADGTDDYALPTTSSAEYAQIIMLKDATHGTLIQKADNETIESYRQTGSTAVIKGFPLRFSLLEGITQIITVRLYPVPNGVYAIDLLRSLLPTRLTAATDVLPFARDVLTAVELRAAARAARSMTDAEREKRLLNDRAIADWMADAESLVREGIRRINQLKRAAAVERVSY